MRERKSNADRLARAWPVKGNLARRAAALFALPLAACTSPAERFDQTARETGLARQVVTGAGFRHALFWRRGAAPSPILHVYIDGDGTLDVAGYAVSDPTPRNPFMLHLLSVDPGPAVLLGRPCYNGLAADPGCGRAIWTSARYSDAVVTSMAAAMRQVLAAGPYRRIVWFGYSGGGALAMLLAARLPETSAVVTVAANLDIDAWADARGFDRLTGSLNPARQPPLAAGILQRHYVGARDDVVPPAVTEKGVSRPDDLRVVPSYDHRCCWEDLWPQVLSDLGNTGLSP